MRQFIVTLCAVVATLIVQSCKKEAEQPGQRPMPPVETKKQVAVVLQPEYLSTGKIDSAVAVWEVDGQRQLVNLTSRNDSLLADVQSSTKGDGKLIIKIYSTLKLQNQYKLQWVQEKPLSIRHNASTPINGPANFTDAMWLPRVALEDAVGNFAVVALRPDDPYFFVKDVRTEVKKLVVFRGYWQTKGGVQQVAGREWQCNQACIDEKRNIENIEFFKTLPAQIGTRTWNHIEIIILFNDSDWGGYSLSINHTLP